VSNQIKYVQPVRRQHKTGTQQAWAVQATLCVCVCLLQGTKTQRRPRKAKADAGSTAAAAAAAASDAVQAGVTAQVSRDLGLSVFHTIGKLLHYKRNPEGDKAAAAAPPPAAAAAVAAAAGGDGDGDEFMDGGEGGASQHGR
jgi:hypothetical protein